MLIRKENDVFSSPLFQLIYKERNNDSIYITSLWNIYNQLEI